jgi:L-threonylcarbamoyladenylate synthase
MALGVDPDEEAAIDRLYKIKERSQSKPLTLFVRDPADWRQYGYPDEAGVAERLVDAFWPGPPFLIVEASDRVSDHRVQHQGTVSIGCIANPTWRELMAYVDGPLAMTSANQSGTVDDDTLIDLELAREHIGDDVDIIINEDPPESATQATTIVDIANGPRLYREGDLTRADLNAVIDIF